MNHDDLIQHLAETLESAPLSEEAYLNGFYDAVRIVYDDATLHEIRQAAYREVFDDPTYQLIEDDE